MDVFWKAMSALSKGFSNTNNTSNSQESATAGGSSQGSTIPSSPSGTPSRPGGTNSDRAQAATFLQGNTAPLPKLSWDRLTRAAENYFNTITSPKNTGKPLPNSPFVDVTFVKNNKGHAHRLNAVQVAFKRQVTTSEKVELINDSYIYGKSPVQAGSSPAQMAVPDSAFLEHEKYLVGGIVSRRGIFQFVSQKKHFRPDKSNDISITEALQTKWKKHQSEGSDLILGGRFKVMSVTPEGPVQSLEKGVAPRKEDMHRICMLVVEDSLPPHEKQSIPITQAGLAFNGKCLKAEQIAHAHDVCAKHSNKHCSTDKIVDERHVVPPIIISTAGRGRGPALIAYSEIVRRIENGSVKDKVSLDHALEEVIGTGRNARVAADALDKKKPDLEGFVHSAEQLNELKIALERYLALQSAPGQYNEGRSIGNSTPAAKEAFNKNRFSVIENAGSGNCLYHSLYGMELKSLSRNPNAFTISLLETDHKDIRRKIAAVLEAKTATEKLDNRIDLELKYFKMRRYYKKDAKKLVGGKNAYEMQMEGKSPREILAEIQRTPGTFAGGMEIEQWLEINDGTTNNQNKIVVLIDALKGGDRISEYRHGEYTVGTDPTLPPQIGGHCVERWAPPTAEAESDPEFPIIDKKNAQQIKDKIDDAIYGKIEDRQVIDLIPIIPENRIVIYRTNGHFVRIESVKRDAKLIAK